MVEASQSGAERFIARVVGNAGALGMPWFQRFLLVLALAILKTIGEEALKLVRFAEAPPEWDPEKRTGNLLPPIDMPEDGIPMERKEWRDGDP